MWPEVTDDYAWKIVLGCRSGIGGDVYGYACIIVELKHPCLLKLSISESK